MGTQLQIVLLIPISCCLPRFWLSFLYWVKVYLNECQSLLCKMAGSSSTCLCSGVLKWWKTQHSCGFTSHFACEGSRTSTSIIARCTESSTDYLLPKNIWPNVTTCFRGILPCPWFCILFSEFGWTGFFFFPQPCFWKQISIIPTKLGRIKHAVCKLVEKQ